MTRQSDVELPEQKPLLILTRVIAAPRALVFKCFADPAYLGRWWGPKGLTCPVSEADFRVGGEFHLVMRSPGGIDYPMRGTFREIVPGRKIVKDDDLSENTEAWHDLVDPARKGQGQRKINILTTLTFEDHPAGTNEDHPAGTKLTITTAYDTIAMRDSFAKIGMSEGWSSSLDKLDDLTDALKDSEREINIRRLIDAPLAKVFQAFSDPQGLAIWWGPDGFTTTSRRQQFRVGGGWDYTMHGPDGTDYPNYVKYTAIEPEKRIAYDHGETADAPYMFKAEITFVAEGEKTLVRLRLILPDAKQRPGYVAFGAVEGGYQNLARLDAWLAKSA